MIQFAPAKLTQRDAVLEIVDAAGYPGADLNFANLFLYREKYGIEIALENRILYRRYKNANPVDPSVSDPDSTRGAISGTGVLGGPPDFATYGYAFPVGDAEPEDMLAAVEADAAERKCPVLFCLITEEQREILESLRPGRYTYHLCRGSSDYLYRRDALVELAGRKYHRKRNAPSRFKQEHPKYKYERLEEFNAADAMRVAESWFRKRELANELTSGILDERKVMDTAIRHFSELGITGGVLYVDGAPVAMSIASWTTRNTCDVHFEKAVPEMPLAFALVCNETARIMDGALYVNRKEDMDIPGLRQAKLSWFPERIIMRYNAVPLP